LAGIPEIFPGLLPTRLNRRFEVMAIKGQTGNRQKKMEVSKSTEVVGFERQKTTKESKKSIAETQGQSKGVVSQDDFHTGGRRRRRRRRRRIKRKDVVCQLDVHRMYTK
jgi:hypothetical protein